ncbi:MAG: HIT family protein [Candidatus Latescibacterota bacterium]
MDAQTRSCVFCEIVAGRAPSFTVAENELSLCILDIHPFTEGHCLVLPRRHVPWWHEMTAAETASLYELARTVARRLMEVYRPEFICQYARGRRIPHTHLLLVPSYPGDPLDRYFNALEGFQEAPRRLAALGEPSALREAAERLRGGGG